jgi:hypothetical protein
MKKWVLILGGIAVLVVLALVCLRLFAGGGEDTWIIGEKGIYIKHGEPASVPAYVLEQQEAIICATDLYSKAKETTMLESQCLGNCGDYAVDIVSVPRTSEDDKEENQCSAFKTGEVKHFIELDKGGNVVRVG